MCVCVCVCEREREIREREECYVLRMSNNVMKVLPLLSVCIPRLPTPSPDLHPVF